MNTKNDRIKELIFALRRDFKISKEIVNSLSKIGTEVIPHLVDAYKIDDFAFKLKIIETLGKMNQLGLSGLMEIIEISDVKMKISILKIMKEKEIFSVDANTALIDELESLLYMENLTGENLQNFTDQIEDILSYRERLAEYLLSSKINSKNSKRIEEIAYITSHIYLRKIKDKEINKEMKHLFSKLKENKAIQILELEEIYKKILKLDLHFSDIFRSFISRELEDIDNATIDKLYQILVEKLARQIIYKKCNSDFYAYNYTNHEIRNFVNVSLYRGIVNSLTTLDIETLKELKTYESIDKIISKLELVSLFTLTEFSLEEIIGTAGENKTILNDMVNLDFSAMQLSDINLEPLQWFLYLEFLTLEENKLASVDISPLERCINLQHLVLSKNKLSSLDLSPLSKCPKIEWLDFSNNLMTTINLNPLSELVNLLELKLNENKLTSIDLGSLSECNQLLEIDLTKNNIQILDVTPLEKCKQLEFLGIDETTKLLWNTSNIPEKENLSQGLQEHYSKLTVAK